MRGAIWPFLPAATMAVMDVVGRWLLGHISTVTVGFYSILFYSTVQAKMFLSCFSTSRVMSKRTYLSTSDFSHMCSPLAQSLKRD